MSDLGNVGVVIGNGARTASFAFGRFATAVINGTGAAPGAQIVVCLRAAPVAAARADDAGDWQINGLDDGTYWAAEVGALRAWLIDVAGASVTVTPQTAGGGGSTIIAGSAYGWVG